MAADGREHDVDFEQVRDLMKRDDQVLIDVREPKEIAETGLIKGSINIPLATIKEKFSIDRDELNKQLGKVIEPNGNNVILSCRSGRRAGLAADILENLGFTEVKVYRGSFLDWVANGGEVVKV